jgi:DNA-binding beta-propeller fold protein YncE
MQSVNPPPRIVAGSGHIGGPGLNHLNLPRGVYVDSDHNVIVVSTYDDRVMFWPPNATFGMVLAGLGNSSNTSMGLNGPYGIGVDEQNSWLYVADAGNNRIQRYSLTGPWPANGTTVAGGYGAGSGSHQLNYPTGVKVSKKTGAIYIADWGNNRIQRWQPGATEGVTIAGDPYGTSGNSATQLSDPSGLALNTNETQIYVTDRSNNRIQRFQLI